MSNQLTLGSLFSGSGGFELGGLISGITPVWASEIEPFPIRVTTKRMPFLKHYGDISKMDGGKIEPVDIITFGSPCQDMSIAGKRDGLDGSRSSLFYEAVRIIKEMRCATDGKHPRCIVWENVPGAFSSNKGEDFRCVLEAVCKIKDEGISVPRCEKWQSAGEILGDGFSLAWRVLDAQYWGVPQRRKRIYLVADFAGGSAVKILFESEGVSGYSPQSFRSWQGAAGNPTESTGTASVCLNDRGCGLPAATSAKQKHRPSRQARPGNRMDITDDTPCILDSAGFCTEHSAKARSIGYEEECAPTLRAGTVPAAVYENHSQDTRYTRPLEVAPTVSSTYGMGGNNQPFVVSKGTPYTLKIHSGCEGSGKGALIQTDKSATLATNNDQTLFKPCNWSGEQIAPTLTKQNAGGSQWMPNKDNFNCVLQPYGICSKDSNSMKSDNPHSGIYEAETARTLDGNGGNPSCNQGGIAVVESYAIQGSMIGRDNKNGPQGNGINEDVSFTLNTVDRHAVYAMTTGSYMQTTKNQSPTLMARDYKDPAAVQSGYTVRRLTPTECARLQGFPDWWCSDLGTENPTEEELIFWKDVFETHHSVVSPNTKLKTQAQIIKWLKNPYSDSAEYKMWGNGVALPCVHFVLSGIVEFHRNSTDGLNEQIQFEPTESTLYKPQNVVFHS